MGEGGGDDVTPEREYKDSDAKGGDKKIKIRVILIYNKPGKCQNYEL